MLYFVLEGTGEDWAHPANLSVIMSTGTVESVEEYINDQSDGGCLDLDKTIVVKQLELKDWKKVKNA